MNFTASSKNRRIRDAVHGLIVFDHDSSVDQLAWALIGTREFQRLRRIRQLGVSEFTFPGAVHTRFVHSIGVFHVARTLIRIIRRELKDDFSQDRANVALIAALLHDLGHGPFSHTFEGVQQERGVTKRHEQWTADIIRNQNGEIFPILEEHQPGFTESVASLLEADDPTDIYHAVVSSSFDADRLDYLRRDRLMTGTGAGAIDFDWLMDNLRVQKVNIEAPGEEDEDEELEVPTFCFTSKALPAAEQFLLARYTLHQQVYFHKTTRCAEKMIGKLLSEIASIAMTNQDVVQQTGLPSAHPLVRFFGSKNSVESYLALDDFAVTGALSLMSQAENSIVRSIALRLQNRCLYKTLDIRDVVGSDTGAQAKCVRRVERKFDSQIKAGTVIKDDRAMLSIYSEIGGDEERIHKRLHILDGESPTEITKMSRMIGALKDKETFTRFFFENESDRDTAKMKKRGGAECKNANNS